VSRQLVRRIAIRQLEPLTLAVLVM
jgi:hypothetical protein